MTELRLVNLRKELAAQCAALELAAFPHVEPSELLGEADIVAYSETFPEGFVVVLDGERVVGQGAGIFLNFDFDHPQHTIAGITGEHQCGNHDPNAEWYYGTDMVTHPEYRRRGIGRMLYEARKELVKRYNKRGIIAGGHMPGYGDHRHELTTGEYLEKVRDGELYDPTLTFQVENGFRIVTLLEGYLHDDMTGGDSALIVWDNPDFGSAAAAS